MLNEKSIDTLCAALAYAMGIEAPKCAAPANEILTAFVDEKFGGEKADRILMYNPDAIAQWIYEKYAPMFLRAQEWMDIEVPFRTVMPSVTPVCFGTMYTGAQPEVHGIRAYEKPVITIDTIFDALIRAGKKVAVIADPQSSIANIFLERDMDYFFFRTCEEINAKAAELIMEDKHDFIVVYNKNYDSYMHKYGPESVYSLGEARMNVASYTTFCNMVERHWKGHNTLVGFAMDHGCHEIDGGCGSHGLDMEEDLNIVHLYKAYPREA